MLYGIICFCVIISTGKVSPNMTPSFFFQYCINPIAKELKSHLNKTRNDLYVFDQGFRQANPAIVLAGIDEAGRGPLAGPVVVAAVVLPHEAEIRFSVHDSKALTERQRGELEEQLLSSGKVRYAIAIRSSGRIDEVNILHATHEAMREVALAVNAELALVDGLKVPDFPVAANFIVKGDSTSASIAAASILAKTHRDRIMLELDAEYPGYGFAKHKGYGTAEHLAALRSLGPCPQHRMSFAPVRAAAGLDPTQMEIQF